MLAQEEGSPWKSMYPFHHLGKKGFEAVYSSQGLEGEEEGDHSALRRCS